METSSITPEIVSEDKALKCLLDAFGSAFSLKDIAAAFCKAGRDPDLASQILCGTQTSPSTHEMQVSNLSLTSEARSQISEGNGVFETSHANDNGFKAPMSKRNPVSMGTVSSVLGKNYVWRVASSNSNLDGTKPLKIDASEFTTDVSSSDHSLLSRNVDSRTPEESSIRRDSDLNDDVENFLFEMLGKGFQLERSSIQEVLGRCGYDMKKSLETLLDLSAANLDKKYEVRKGTNFHSGSESYSSHNQVRNQKIADSNRLGNNGFQLRQPNGRYEQEKEVLTSLFHVPERHDTNLSSPIVKLSRRFRVSERVVNEPLEDLSVEHTAINTRASVANIKDDDDDSAYHMLRKAVKEHRDTMKEYYKAATEAFSSGDRVRAMVLREKGQFYYNKAREADEESASKIFEIRSGDGETQDDMSLDLQEHDAKEAIKLVKCHLRSLSGISSFKNLKVVTGNNGRDAEKRKRLVMMLLERASIKFTVDETASAILIPLDEINPTTLNFARK